MLGTIVTSGEAMVLYYVSLPKREPMKWYRIGNRLPPVNKTGDAAYLYTLEICYQHTGPDFRSAAPTYEIRRQSSSNSSQDRPGFSSRCEDGDASLHQTVPLTYQLYDMRLISLKILNTRIFLSCLDLYFCRLIY